MPASHPIAHHHPADQDARLHSAACPGDAPARRGLRTILEGGMRRLRTLDARLYQIAFQATLLSVGVIARDFHPALGADGAGFRRRAGDPGLLDAPPRSAAGRRVERRDHLLRHVAAAAGRQPVGASAGGLPGAVGQVRRANQWQAPVQPGQPGRDHRHRAAARRMGIAGAMGQRPGLCRVVRRAGRHRDATRAPLGHQLDLPRLLARAGCAAGSLARPVVEHLAASAGQRRAAAVRLLHDLRPDDDTQSHEGPRHAMRLRWH